MWHRALHEWQNERMKTRHRGLLGVILLAVSTASAAGTPSPLARTLKLYRNEDLHFQIKVPKRWIELKSTSMVGFRSRKSGPSASIGILRDTRKGMPIEQAARKDYKARSRPKDWQQNLVKINGRRALKVQATLDPNRTRRLLMYYIEGPEGFYLIECLAPADQWPSQEPLFKTMVKSFDIL
jgi:hypothetical protein